LSLITQPRGRVAHLVSPAREKTRSILHDCSRVPELAHLLLMGWPWIYTDSYTV